MLGSPVAQFRGLKSSTLCEHEWSVRDNRLARRADTTRTLDDGLLQRYKEGSAAAGITASNVSVVDEAAVPIDPSSPDLLLNLALALLAGVVIAGGAVFVREQLDDAIREPEEIYRKTGLTTLGRFPNNRAPEQPADLDRNGVG